MDFPLDKREMALLSHRMLFGASKNSVSGETRRRIVDTIQMEKIRWAGCLDQDTFLGRLFDLASLPSTDTRARYNTAGADIHQHTVSNNDWDVGWIFSDARFGLMNCHDEIFLRFLCEMVHPVVRSDADEVFKIVTMFNRHLAKDGWNIFEAETISARPVFEARRSAHSGLAVANQVKVLAEKVDSTFIDKQIASTTEAVKKDTKLAVGIAKELVDTVCKTAATGKPPSCFISYSWDSDAHKDWVRNLATALKKNGIETRLDQWNVRLGTDLPLYMETSIRESDYVLLICTPKFAEKADAGKGGVGYEKTIVTGEIFQGVERCKFIPLLRYGSPRKALPAYLKSKAFADFRDDNTFQKSLKEVLHHIFNEPEFSEPELGKKPSLRNH